MSERCKKAIFVNNFYDLAMTTPTHIFENKSPRTIELLAPARNPATAIAAIDHGADAVYMGASSHGARRQAANSVSDIASVVRYAHKFNARVYVTVNTIVYDNELADVEKLVWQLYRVGVDALIVQDMSLLKMNLPPIALHASTQCDIRTPEKARFLQDAGFSQLVLPRELTLREIAAFRDATTVPLEAFVHGALCVSFSGDCQASFVLTGRSTNRGDCAQICRFVYDLEDSEGNCLVKGKHLLSLKDMNRIASLGEMLEAGVSSFKIEGRLKDENYVKNVVSAYSRALDNIVRASNGAYRRLSRGVVEYAFTPELSKCFNRGYTDYFLHSRRPSGSMASIDSPKWTGEKVATVVSVMSKRAIVVRADKPLANGDGLGYFNASGRFVGFRLNRVDGNRLYVASDVDPRRGDAIYRNSDIEWNRRMEKQTARRFVPLDFRLRATGSAIVLEASDCDGVSVAVSVDFSPQKASSPQHEYRIRALGKLGDTFFSLKSMTDEMPDMFVPASVLGQLKRDVVAAMQAAYESRYSFDRRREMKPDLTLPHSVKISRHDNIANRIAEKFYSELSGNDRKLTMPKAVEVSKCNEREMRVMQTRYCLRRELGACLATADGRQLPSPLFISSGGNRFRLDFDCANCVMSVIAQRK